MGNRNKQTKKAMFRGHRPCHLSDPTIWRIWCCDSTTYSLASPWTEEAEPLSAWVIQFFSAYPWWDKGGEFSGRAAIFNLFDLCWGFHCLFLAKRWGILKSTTFFTYSHLHAPLLRRLLNSHVSSPWILKCLKRKIPMILSLALLNSSRVLKAAVITHILSLMKVILHKCQCFYSSVAMWP